MAAADERSRTVELLPEFLNTVVIVWVDGRPRVLTGDWAHQLPGRRRKLHVVTAANPNGKNQTSSVNKHLHAELIREVDQLAHRSGARPVRWWPAVGTSPDGAHAELSVAVAGLARREAIKLAQRHDQLAVFELTSELEIVVPCVDGVETVEAQRDRWELANTLTFAHFDQWWTGHDRAAAIVDVPLEPLASCDVCGSSHMTEILYGMPMGPPPPWITVGGCVLTTDQPLQACAECGATR